MTPTTSNTNTRKQEPSRPTVSAVVPVKNGQDFVAECLRSIENQTVPVIEIIVVDDGCSDNSLEVITETASTMSVPMRVVAGGGRGQSAARNAGVAQATGDLVALIDQDDVWDRRHVAVLLEALVSHEGSRIAYCDFTIFDENSAVLSTSFNFRAGNSHPKASVLEIIREDVFALPSCMLINRQAFLDLGGFDVMLQGFEDDEFYLRAFQAAWAPVYVPEALTLYRTHRRGNSRSSSFWRSRVRYAHLIAENFPDDPWIRRFWLRDVALPRFRHSIMLDFSAALALGDKAAAKELAQSLRTLMSLTTELSLRVRLGLWVMHRPALARVALRPYFRRAARRQRSSEK